MRSVWLLLFVLTTLSVVRGNESSGPSGPKSSPADDDDLSDYGTLLELPEEEPEPDKSVPEAVYAAIDTKDVEKLRQMHRDGVDLLTMRHPKFERPLLVYAATKPDLLDVVNVLMELGTDPNVRNEKDNITAIMEAAYIGSFDVVKALVEKGARHDIRDWIDNTVYMYAGAGGSVAIVEYLLDKFGPVVLETKNNMTLSLLDSAVYNDRRTLVQFLVREKGASYTRNSLALAAGSGWMEIFEDALKVTSIDEMFGNETALLRAAKAGKNHAAKWLLEHGARKQLDDAFDAFASAGNVEMAKLLSMTYGAKASGSSGTSVLEKAVQNDKKDMIETLLEQKTVCDCKCQSSLLTLGRCDIFRRVLAYDDSCLSKNVDNATVLLDYAVAVADEDCAIFILDRKGIINPKPKMRNSTLIIAAANGFDALVEKLIAAGADPAHNEALDTAAHWASFNGHESIVRKLGEAYPTMLGAVNSGEWSPLTLAARNGYAGIVEYLISKRVPLDPPTGLGNTPLLLAAKFKHEKVVRLLVDAGANAKHKNKEAKTPLYWAQTNNMAKDLIEKMEAVGSAEKGTKSDEL